MKGAVPAEKTEKVKGKTPGGELQDGGEPVVEPEAKKSPTDVTDKSAKEVGGDAQQKSEGKPMKMVKGHGKDDGTPTANKSQAMAAGYEHEDGEFVAEEEMSKKDLMAAMHKKMEGMDKKDLMAAYGSMNAGYHEETDDNIEERISDINVKEDVSALISGEDLSEEFKIKAATIFEAAVKSKTREEVTRIHENMTSEFEEKLEESVEALTEKVDTYLNYVVEEWTKENELAIERGLKGEIAEDFISGLKQLFEDHYIDVPDEKYDVLEAQSDKIAELEEQLNSIMEANIQMNSVNSELVREQVILEVASDLTDTEIEKFASLVEDIDFGDEDGFRAKLDTLKESYFPKSEYLEETFIHDEDDYGSAAQDIDTSDTMQKYMSAIGRVETRINGR